MEMEDSSPDFAKLQTKADEIDSPQILIPDPIAGKRINGNTMKSYMPCNDGMNTVLVNTVLMNSCLFIPPIL
jgi:hypothetical protein